MMASSGQRGMQAPMSAVATGAQSQVESSGSSVADEECRALVAKSTALLQLFHARKHECQRALQCPRKDFTSLTKEPQGIVKHDASTPPSSQTDAAGLATSSRIGSSDAQSFHQGAAFGDDVATTARGQVHEFTPLRQTSSGLLNCSVGKETDAERKRPADCHDDSDNLKAFGLLPVGEQKAALSAKLCELYTLLHIFFS